MRERIIGVVSDNVSDLLYYDRKGDEDLPVGSIEKAILDGVISIEEIVEIFRDNLKRCL